MPAPLATGLLLGRVPYLERSIYVLLGAQTISAYAKDMKDFLQESELTERRSFIESFVKEIIVIPGDALIRYTVPMPDDSFLAGRATEKVALDASVLSTVHVSPPDCTEFITRPLRAISAASAPPIGLSSGVGME